MYRKYYDIKEKPFNVTSDPSFLYLSRKHKEAFSHLIYGIEERKGFLEITGEIGTGKTTLCRALLNKLNGNTKTAFVLNPDLSQLQLLQVIMEDFGMHVEKKSKMHMFRQLNKFLLGQLALNNNVVLIIDEAQNLKPSVLEQLRLLSNLETEKEKLFQMVLVGQPELRDRLNSPNLRQLRQRISVRYHIMPLDRDEVNDYIYHRLAVAGSKGGIVFKDKAIDLIHGYSGGVPRLINIVCDKALLLGFVLETRTITFDIVMKSINEVEGRPHEHN
ncbi:MAG: AAA family ATPase [Candidatus Omnitrophica bacterium]|nr:AAA family ATPase [Candidatus Omnitrophota bacterium]